MKHLTRLLCLWALQLSFSTVWAQIPTWTGTGTPGTLSIAVTTSSTAIAEYAPRHVVTFWISTSNGTVLKTVVYNAAKYASKLGLWVSTGQTPDVVSGASLTSFRTYNLSWDGKDKNGNLVDDGTYTVHLELNDCNIASSSSRFAVNFTKGTAVQTLTPANVQSFSAMKFVWTPSVTTVVPSVAIAANTTSVCAGQPVTLTATPTNGGTAPLYQWKVNNVNVGTSSPTYTYTPTADQDKVTCVLTSNAAGASPTTATSGSVTITLKPVVTPTVTIYADKSKICASGTVTFTASALNGGTASAFQWKNNGNTIGTNAYTLTSSSINNGDKISCVLTSNAACASSTTAISNEIAMTVTPTVVPSVTITAPSTTVCSGSTVTVTASPVNGGTPSYQWTKNGLSVGTNAETYSYSTPATGDIIACTMTSTAACASPTTAVSNALTIDVVNNVVPTVEISTPSTSVCLASPVVFTATVTNAGTPSYAWKLNGNTAGSDAPTFQSSNIANGDKVSCEITATGGCSSVKTAVSNELAMTVNTVTVPSVSIWTKDSSVCASESVTFTAVPLNGGTPSYKWMKNGTVAGNNASTYTDNQLANNDIITCEMTSTDACASSPTAVSQPINMFIQPAIVPTISIVADMTSLCEGAVANFTATATNGGLAPQYSWKINGTATGTNAPTLASATLANGDKIACSITSNALCAAPATVLSNELTVSVIPAVHPQITITQTTQSACSGAPITFNAAISEGLIQPVYSWRINGQPAGSNSNTFTTSSLANGDKVSCILTSATACLSQAQTESNSITMQVTSSVKPAVALVYEKTPVCEGTAVAIEAVATDAGTASYQWKKNGISVGTNSNVYTDPSVKNSDQIQCEVTSSLACASPRTAVSDIATFAIANKETPSLLITASQTSICNGVTVTFTASPQNGGTAPVYTWILNGEDILPSTASTFSTATLSDGDVITCSMTGNATCVTQAGATSNPISITENMVTPSVSILTPTTTVCAGSAVEFTAYPVNGGSAPVFAWTKNGQAVGSNAAIYTDQSMHNGDAIACIMTSNATCVTKVNVASGIISMTVLDVVNTSVSISTTATSICTGAPATFDATAVARGPVSFQWIKNGDAVGNNATSYTDNLLADNDIIECQIAASEVCASSASARSNKLQMTVKDSVYNEVTIIAEKTSICAGELATFTATETGGGTEPVFQWTKNGVSTGASTRSYEDSKLNDADIIACNVTSSAACTAHQVAVSNGIAMKVLPNTGPSVTVVAPSVVCEGAAAEYSAQAVTAGTPAFAWTRNGTLEGGNEPTFLISNPVNGDKIICTVTDAASCGTVKSVSSNVVSVVLQPKIVPQIFAFTESNALYDATNVTFTAINPDSRLTVDQYRWMKNGYYTGGDAATYLDQYLASGDVVWCEIVTNNVCAQQKTAVSNKITISINPIEIRGDITDITVAAGLAAELEFRAAPYTSDYQWQVDMGNGFADIESSPLYGGIKRNVLGITAVADSMNGYKYRCIITSGLFSDTSAVATLTVGVATSNAAVYHQTHIVFPTVSRDYLTVEGIAEGLQIQIVDANGVVVSTAMSNGSATVLCVSGLPQGEYMVRSNGLQPSVPFFKQ